MNTTIPKYERIKSRLEVGGPYKAEPVGPYGYWCVSNKFGLNIACCVDKPGATLMDERTAKYYADEWNKQMKDQTAA